MSKMSPRANKVPEMIWFLMALLCLILAITITLQDGFRSAYAIYAFVLISSVMYFLRRHIRKSSNNL